MYAKELFLGISLFGIFFVLGIVAALVLFDKLSKIRGMSQKSNSFYYIVSIGAIIGGYLSAVLVQSIYNWIENGYFEFGGMTFLGGLAGGILVFFIIFFCFARGEVRGDLGKMAEIAAPCAAIGQGIGRFGCFFAGCCYGKHAEGFFSFLGVVFKYGDGADGLARYPTQLFEAFFLIALAVVLIILNVKKKNVSLAVYFAAYGIFRFLIEFIRGDDRGSIGSSFFSPSQVWSIVLVLVALVLVGFMIFRKKKPEAYNKIMKFFKLDSESLTLQEENIKKKKEQAAENKSNDNDNKKQ